MLTVLIPFPRNAFDLAVSLHDLVSGAVDGLVREAIVVGAPGGEIAEVAEHAGCRLVGEPEFLAPGFPVKGEWLLVVSPGKRLAAGWIEAAARHMGQAAGGAPARFASIEPRPLWRRFWPAETAAWLVPGSASMADMRAAGRIEMRGAARRARRLRVDAAR